MYYQPWSQREKIPQWLLVLSEHCTWKYRRQSSWLGVWAMPEADEQLTSRPNPAGPSNPTLPWKMPRAACWYPIFGVFLFHSFLIIYLVKTFMCLFSISYKHTPAQGTWALTGMQLIAIYTFIFFASDFFLLCFLSLNEDMVCNACILLPNLILSLPVYVLS